MKSPSSSPTHTAHRVLVCACANSDLTPREKVDTFLKDFSPPDAEVIAVPDLCRLAAKDRDRLAEYADADKLTVVACFPRTVRSLLEWSEIDVDDDALEIHNLRTDDPEAIRKLIETNCAEASAGQDHQSEPAGDATAAPVTEPEDGWIPWFPVIERDRCTNCAQCLSFCLFGVYEVVDGKVEVTNPDNCKNGCPACARICPEVAIIFPKYENSPVNGDEITNVDEQKERIRVDMQKILGDNVYAALAERRRMRKQRVLLRKQKGQEPAAPACACGNDHPNPDTNPQAQPQPQPQPEDNV